MEERLPLDGTSVFERDPQRALLAEYHVEKVRAPCFMVRRGSYKYVYVHGHDEQLFDLAADPGEWNDLAAERSEVTAELRALILARFDPDAIAADGAASVRRRDLIRRANERNGTRWDYEPRFDATRQYVR